MTRMADADRDRLAALIAAHRSTLAALPGFVGAEPGYPILDGWVVGEPAIIVYTASTTPGAASARIESLDGVPVVTIPASIDLQLAVVPLAAGLRAQLSASDLTYEGLPGDPIDADFACSTPVLCHVGPDAGWPVLAPFLSDTERELVVAMYDFNADWIVERVLSVVGTGGRRLTLTWDDGFNEAEEAIGRRPKRELGNALDAWVVKCGSGRRFASAYHEKVAVRDGRSFWLSSGNWSRRSQPDVNPVDNPEDRKGLYSAGNREWHVVVHDELLAGVFKDYIVHDRQGSEGEGTALAQRIQLPDVLVPLDAVRGLDAALAAARPVAPAELPTDGQPFRVQALLSPDNYHRRVRELIASARRSLYLQFSYITYPRGNDDDDFEQLLQLVADRSQEESLDVRIIVGNNGAAEKIAKLVTEGFNADCLRVQTGVHNKGIIVDGHTVLVSSANWSADGVLRNRDAGLILHSPEVAQYYEAVFLFDWDERAKARVDVSAGAAFAVFAEGPTPPGWARLSWKDFEQL